MRKDEGKKKAIKPCPFCGSDAYPTTSIWVKNGCVSYVGTVVCSNEGCKCRGPAKKAETRTVASNKAMIGWDKRHMILGVDLGSEEGDTVVVTNGYGSIVFADTAEDIEERMKEDAEMEDEDEK